jgi:NDP-sugar pyrophosphorylase family protein
MMQVVILAGGLGTRLRTVSGDLPKSLVPVAGRPFIEHQLALLTGAGLTRVLLCLGYGAGQVRNHLGDGSSFGVELSYVEEDPGALLGTGGALVNALPALDESFLVLYGDSFLPTKYADIVSAFTRGGAEAMMTVFRNRGRWDHSNVRIRDGKVVHYSKKTEEGAADCIDYGLSAFRKTVIATYRDAAMPLDLATILEDLVLDRRLDSCEVEQRFYEVGTPEGLADLEAYLAERGGTAS